MVPPLSDPRAVRTRQVLQNSFAALLASKTYKNIRIQQVLDAAQVSRSTFYTHFSGKEALLNSLQEQLPIQLKMALAEEQPTALLQLLFEHAAQAYMPKNKELLALMLPQLETWLGAYFTAQSQRHWRGYQQLDLWQPVAIAGLSTLLKTWLEQGGKDREVVIEKAERLLVFCLAQAQ